MQRAVKIKKLSTRELFDVLCDFLIVMSCFYGMCGVLAVLLVIMLQTSWCSCASYTIHIC